MLSSCSGNNSSGTSSPVSHCCDGMVAPTPFRAGHFSGGAVEASRVVPQEDERVAALLAKEMNQLTVQEREDVYEDIHGVNQHKVIRETPTLIEDGLRNMRKALETIPKTKRRAYDRALFFRPSLATDDKFQLMFLRCHRYDASLAAKRLCSHLEVKHMLFGTNKVAKRITLDDLSSDDMASLELGSWFFLPERDRSGRKVVFANALLHNYTTWQNMVRCIWYMLMSDMEDNEDFQTKGYVCIGCLMSMEGTYTPRVNLVEYLSNFFPLVHEMPASISAFHCITDNPMFQRYTSIAQLLSPKDHRLRFRSHHGSLLENQYALLTFGIVIDDSYFDEEKLRIRMLDLIATWRRSEQTLQATQDARDETNGIITCPRSKDVLLGRGRCYQEYSGNVRLNDVLLPQYSDRYGHGNDRLEKSFVALDVMTTLKAEGGRFLKRSDEGWKIEEGKAPQLKISQALRSMVREQQNNSGGGIPNSYGAPQQQHHLIHDIGLAVSPSAAKRMRFST